MSDTDFELVVDKSIRYYTIPSFDNTKLVKSIFTTRINGYSKNEFKGLNLGLKTYDQKSNLINNYKIVSDILNTSLDRFVISDQLHNTNIRFANEFDCGKGLIKDLDYENVDGLITNQKNIVLCTVYADCVPLFFLDPTKEAIGLAHAGWKGTVNKIAEKMINRFIEKFNSSPKDILVAIGPSIGKCCYVVGENVYNKFNTSFQTTDNIFIKIDDDKWMLDLWQANKKVLMENGILNGNITTSNLCTNCKDEFYSYRREKGKTGRMGAFLKLI